MFLTLLPYLTVVANLILVLGILFTLSQRVRELRGDVRKHEAALQTETARLSAEIAELKTKLQEIEDRQRQRSEQYAAQQGVENASHGAISRENRRISAAPSG